MKKMRLRVIVNTLKKSGFIGAQEDLTKIIKNKHGQNVSRAYVSQLVSRRHPVKIPDSVVDQLCTQWPFINKSYYYGGEGLPFDQHTLLKYLCKQAGLTQRAVSKKVAIPESSISKLSEDDERWESIYSLFNSLLKLTLSHFDITEYGMYSVKAKSESVTRFFNVLEYLLDSGKVINETQFAEEIIGVHRQNITNMKNGDQGLSAKYIRLICLNFPEVSAYYLLGLEDEMLRKTSEAMFYTLQRQQTEILRAIESR